MEVDMHDGGMLPPELLLHTFENLQALDLCRASLVCGLWRNVGGTSSLWY
jgi:hypothetical protein